MKKLRQYYKRKSKAFKRTVRTRAEQFKNVFKNFFSPIYPFTKERTKMEKRNFNSDYSSLVYGYLEEVSAIINEGGKHYETHLKCLEKLLTTGKTDPVLIEKINKTLVQLITEVPPENACMTIEIKANADAYGELIDKLNNMIKKYEEGLDGSEDVNFDNFRNSFRAEIEEGLEDILITKKVIEVSCPEVNAPAEIMDEYIQNYICLNRPEYHTVDFSKTTIQKYYNFIEYKIKTEEDESLLNDNIVEAVSLFIHDITSRIDNIPEDVDSFRGIMEKIKYNFGWIEDGETGDKHIQASLNDFKAGIQKKIIDLAERANSEIFPFLLEKRVNESRNKHNQVVMELAQLIKGLEDRRTILLETIRNDRIDEYRRFITLSEDVSTHSKAFKEIERISEQTPAIPLSAFTRKRNDKSLVIKSQLSKDVNESYVSAKEKIDGLASAYGTETEQGDLIRYFIHSVQLFMKELERTVLGDLEMSFEEIREKTKGTTRLYEEKLKVVSQDEKNYLKWVKQEKINSLLASMNGYSLPSRIADEVLGSFALNSEHEVETFLKAYTEETFTSRVYELLDEKSLEEVFSSSPEKIAVFKEVSGNMTTMRVSKIKEYGSIFKDIAKDVISSEGLISLATVVGTVSTGLVAGIVFTTAFGIYKAIKENGKREQEAVSVMRESLKKIIHQVGSVMIKDKFDILLKEQSRKLNQQS